MSQLAHLLSLWVIFAAFLTFNLPVFLGLIGQGKRGIIGTSITEALPTPIQSVKSLQFSLKYNIVHMDISRDISIQIYILYNTHIDDMCIIVTFFV